MYDIIIVGAGTAGLSAAIYATRSGKSVLVLEGTAYGGQIINTPEIENYPGIKHTSGFEFATGLYEQAKEHGAEIKYEKVIGIESANGEHVVVTAKEKYPCKAVILATGTVNKKLGLTHEDEWIGAGISYCATCDGAFYKGKDVAVNGGGNTALEDAIFLSGYGNKVYLVHRRDEFRGEHTLVEELKAKANVEFVLNSNIVALEGDRSLEAIVVEDKNTGEKRNIPVSGLFLAIGRKAGNEPFAGSVQLDDWGYIEAGEDCKTNIPGIFTAGDCRTKAVRQLTTAAADGAVAALAACQYIKE